jgi:hypothetical protein
MTTSAVELAEFLREFSGQEEGDLDRLDAVICEAVSMKRDDALDAALFGIFERFPEEDGYGVYWSILHGLEGRGDYEDALLASLRRSPSRFALTMVNRILNAGQSTCAGVPALALLEAVAASPSANPSAREEATTYLNHQRGGS